MNILPIFCDVDDFCLLFEPRWHQRLLQSRAALSQPLAAFLQGQDLRLITRLKRNMKNKFLSLTDKLLLRKRALLETVVEREEAVI